MISKLHCFECCIKLIFLGDNSIKFGSVDEDTCYSNLKEEANRDDVKAWAPIILHGVNEFTARIGPTGGTKGYIAQTGKLEKVPIATWEVTKLKLFNHTIIFVTF